MAVPEVGAGKDSQPRRLVRDQRDTPKGRFVSYMQTSSKLILFIEVSPAAVIAFSCDKLPHTANRTERRATTPGSGQHSHNS